LRLSHMFTIGWYAWRDSNPRPVAPEESGSKSHNLLSLFLPCAYVVSGILLSLEVDPLSSQIDRVLAQFWHSRWPHDRFRRCQTHRPVNASLAAASHAGAAQQSPTSFRNYFSVLQHCRPNRPKSWHHQTEIQTCRINLPHPRAACQRMPGTRF
jgi:hypothetical protein